MGRYRPAAPQSSKYITPEGVSRLREELDHLWRIKRPAVTQAVAEAAAQGDRSENAEYIYGKRQLAEIDRRVRYLRKRLDGMRVVDAAPTDTQRIFFGARFELIDADDNEHRYRLVGPDEIDFAAGNISMDSPLGKAVRGRAVGEYFEHAAPQGIRRYWIKSVSYTKKVPGT